MQKEDIDVKLREKQRDINFDIKEFTVELLINKFKSEDLYIPYYQRKYVWDEQRKRKFIESVLLGLPIPYLFGADRDVDGNIEIIDGVQRLSTLDSFYKNEIVLKSLEKLDFLENLKMEDLPVSQQKRFLNRTIRMIVLDQKCTEEDRLDIFERINTTSERLKDSELRKGAYHGAFWKFVAKCADNKKFQELCPISDINIKRGEREELILRFFAYSDDYMSFQHSVKDFLNKYLKRKNEEFKNSVPQTYEDDFIRMLQFVSKNIGTFAKSSSNNSTPRVRFEAIAVGVNLALKQKPNLIMKNKTWLDSKEFQKQTTSDASNNRSKLRSRIEYVRDILVE